MSFRIILKVEEPLARKKIHSQDIKYIIRRKVQFWHFHWRCENQPM